jgi:hypothetical protein
MSNEEIIAQLVKGRERCRQLVQFYQKLHAGAAGDPAAPPDKESLEMADRILTQVLAHLHSLPRKPSEQIADATERENAGRLLREIGDLIECAMVAERELRERAASQTEPPAGPARNSALKMYART